MSDMKPMERIDYEKMARLLNSPHGWQYTANRLHDVATAAAEAQREACYDHTLQTLGCVETARIVRETKLITESEAK